MPAAAHVMARIGEHDAGMKRDDDRLHDAMEGSPHVFCFRAAQEFVRVRYYRYYIIEMERAWDEPLNLWWLRKTRDAFPTPGF